ncbi:MAG TPA: DNRLRE domain-containing protein [Acidimicrobiales bacterium]
MALEELLRGRYLLKVKTILAGTGTLGFAFALWVTVLSPGAQSQSAPTVSLVQSTWFWQGEASPPGGVSLPQTVPDPAVPSGDLAVGGPEVQGQAPAETYLEFDVSSIPQGSTISSFKISLPVDPSAQSLVPAGTVPPIVACSPQQPWPAAPGPQPYGQKPADHCDPGAPKVSSGDGGKTYTVDIASIASAWVANGQNFGVAITDDPSNTSTAYQVVFGPSSAVEKIQATVDYSPPPSGLGGSSIGNETPAVVNGPSPEGPSGVAAPSVPASPILPATGTGGTPPATATPPVASTLPSATTPQRVKSAAASHHTATSTPPAGFWIVAALLAALVGVCMLELRRPPEMSLATTERGVGKLLSHLAARQEDGPAQADGGP